MQEAHAAELALASRREQLRGQAEQIAKEEGKGLLSHSHSVTASHIPDAVHWGAQALLCINALSL